MHASAKQTLAALSSLLLLTCGDPSPEEACGDLAAAICNKLESCSSTFVQVTYGDVTTCITRTKLGCQTALDAPSTSLTPDQLADCASALSAESCDDQFDPTPPEPCRPRAGGLADGVACADDTQCRSTYCNKQGKTCGVCGKRAAAGEACTTDEDCEWDLACGSSVCVTYASVGESCDPDHPCREPIACDSSGTCAKPGGAGASCEPTDQTTCDLYQGLFCGLDKTCKQLGINKDGEACGLVEGTFTVCARSGKCKGGGMAGKGTCLAAAADGAACDLAQGPLCLPPARCVEGSCKLEDPAACK
jgi:hypothetical protein